MTPYTLILRFRENFNKRVKYLIMCILSFGVKYLTLFLSFWIDEYIEIRSNSRLFQAIVQEGREPIEFWTVLGGQDPYANDDSKYRLFAIETGPDGSIEAVEVFDFDQTNLSNRRVAILDAGQ